MGIVFNRQQGGLGRALAGEDHYSGVIFYTDTLPSGFDSGDRIKKVLNLAQAEALGITDDYSDETKATGGQAQITLTGATGDTTQLLIDGGVLGEYTVASGDDVAAIASGLVDAINAETFTHGWEATLSTDTVQLTPPNGLGDIPNDATISFYTDGAATASVTQFTGGVSSYYKYMHYVIEEFFRINPKGVLWVGIYAEKTFDGTEIETVSDYADGKIRQMGVSVTHSTFASSLVTSSQTYAEALAAKGKPLSVIIGGDYTGVTFANLIDLSTLDSERVSATIGTDGEWNYDDWSATTSYLVGQKINFLGKIYQAKSDAVGKTQSPFDSDYWTEVNFDLTELEGFTVTDLGAVLGIVSLANVSDNIGWKKNDFRLDGTDTLEEAGIVTGSLYKDLSEANKTSLKAKAYIYLQNVLGLTGVWVSDSWTATLKSSDYATIENNRTIDKATRDIRINLAPYINSPLFVNEDGTLQDQTIELFKNASERALEDMVTAEELSQYEVSIDADQDVLATSKIVISGKLIPVGVAREIEFNIGFVVKL